MSKIWNKHCFFKIRNWQTQVSIISYLPIRGGLIFIEKCQIFQCKTKCKQKIKLSRASELQNLKKQWSQKKLFENILIKIEFLLSFRIKTGKIFKSQEYEITSNLNLAVSVCVKCHTEKSCLKDFGGSWVLTSSRYKIFTCQKYEMNSNSI